MRIGILEYNEPLSIAPLHLFSEPDKRRSRHPYPATPALHSDRLLETGDPVQCRPGGRL